LRFLALHAGRHVHRDAIVEAVWGDDQPRNVLHNLHVSISSVRRSLEPGAARGHEELVVRYGEAYSLALPSGSVCDVVELDRLADAARRRERSLAARPDRGRAGEPDPADLLDAARAWQDVLDGYTGELFPSERPVEWVVSAREHFRLLAAEAADAVASLKLRVGRAADAAAAARRAVEIDRWGDAGWRLLVRALRLAGDDGSATRAELEYHAVLRELGVGRPDLTDPGTRSLRPRDASWGSLGRSRRP
jgi:two-component SAPR family response regulator